MKQSGLWLAIGWAMVITAETVTMGRIGVAASLPEPTPERSPTSTRVTVTPTPAPTTPIMIRNLPPVCGMLEIRAGYRVLLDASMFPVEEALREFIFSRQYQPALEFLQRIPADAPDVDSSLILSGLKLLTQAVAANGSATERRTLRDYALRFIQTSDESIWVKAANLRDVAKIYLTASQTDDAIALAKVAMQLTNTMPEGSNVREIEQDRLVELFTDAGLVEAAIQVVDASQDDYFRVSFRYQQAKYAEQQGQPEPAQVLYQQALTLAQTRLPAPLKAEWLMTLATPLHIPPAQLQQWVTEVATVLPTVPNRTYRPTLMLKLATQQQRLGQTEAAQQQVQAAVAIAQAIAKETNSEFVLAYFVKQALEAKQLDAANQMMALGLKVTSDPDRFREALSRDYAANGYFDEALQHIDRIKKATTQEAARVNVLLSALELSRFDLAQSLMQRTKDPFIRERATAGLIARYLETGKQSEALQLARQPGNFDILLLVAEQFNKRQGAQYPPRPDLVNWVLDQATQIAEGLPNLAMRQEAIATVAGKAAYLLQFDRAMTLAAMLPASAQADVYEQISRNVWPAMERAEASTRKFVTALPDSLFKLQITQQLAGHYTMRAQKAVATALLDEATRLAQQLSPNDVSNLERIARAYWTMGEPGKALQLVEAHNLLTKAPDGPIQRIELAVQAGKIAQAQQLLVALRQQAEAMPVASAPVSNDNDAIVASVKLLAQLATQYANLGDRDQATNLLAQAVKRQKTIGSGSQPVTHQLNRDRNEALTDIVVAYTRLIARYAEAGQRDRATMALNEARLITQTMAPDRRTTLTDLLQCLQSSYSLSN